MSNFTEGQRVRVIADGSTGSVSDPDYVYGGVLVMPDNPSRPWAPLTPYLPSELEAVRECRFHGEVDSDHMARPCRRPGESAMEFTDRVLGYTRDV